MQISLDERIGCFARLGNLLEGYLLGSLENEEIAKSLNKGVDDAICQNPWFNRDNISTALSGISYLLDEKKLKKWLEPYRHQIEHNQGGRDVAVIMAGNIPFVSFHDLLCVLITGNKFKGKLSANDSVLPVVLADLLIGIEPLFGEKISFTKDILKGFDAVIATGSDNSSRYFDYYFSKYPHIIRKNRNSIVVLRGDEDLDALNALSDDIFRYYGMGCRNVSKIFVPVDYDFKKFFEAMEGWSEVKDFYKYRNNYDYYKAMFLINKTMHYDNGFMLMKEDKGLSSPLSVLYYQNYKSSEEIVDYLVDYKSKIQCLVASENFSDEFGRVVPFGSTQYPELWDYADGVDTIEFLINFS